MTSKRDHLFPSTSIGRVQGARIQRTPSHESLTAHPLLSPTSTPPSFEQGQNQHQQQQQNGTNPNGTPRYVPYTPRQRVTTTSATTGTTAHTSVSASPQHHQGDATSKLQLMNLKAAAQNVGLDTGTVGWMILEKLVFESDHSVEWTEIWNAVTIGKATLLLPLEQASAHEKFTPDFVKDHVVLCDGPLRKKSPVVTLSGLRGVLDGETLTLRSSICPISKPFQELLIPSTRAPSLAALPPLPHPLSVSLPNPYPNFSLPSYTSTLPLPPRAAGPSKPPLPPRPQVRSTPPQTPSRLPNPFASLFGSKSSPSTTPQQGPPVPLPIPDIEHVVEVSAFTIDRRIVRKDVGKEMNKALKGEVKESLAGLSGWVVERVHDFTVGLYPLVKASKKSAQIVGGSSGSGTGSITSGSPAYVVNAFHETPEEASERFQEFYGLLEQDLRMGGTPFLGRRKEEHLSGVEEKDRRVQEKVESEAKIREIMETVERTICSLFYDRLFLQPTCDDSSHDEALSGRVAALNMLDLGLEHLDIHVGNIGTELDLVVRACGETLTQLDVACRTPGDKAAVLVAAHKILVDGLSRLPPIKLKSESESKTQKMQQASLLEKANSLAIDAASQPQSIDTSGARTFVSSPSPITPIMLPPESDPTSSTTDISSKLPPLPLSSPASAPPSESLLTMSPPPEPTPVSGDVLLPMIIFSVVKANPPHLVSHLLYTQRFRNHSVGGEESYCLINLMAVAEFLENVDLAALGLGDSEKVMSTADLTPIPLNRSPMTADAPLLRQDDLGSLRGRVEQGVDAIAGSANKVITGVVDSSFGILRSFLPNSPDPVSPPNDGLQDTAPWNTSRPGFGLLRRQSSGFSIASIAASLPIPGARGGQKSIHSVLEESGQPLVAVSRPGSVKSTSMQSRADGEGSSEEGSSEDGDGDEGREDEEDEEDEEEGEVGGGGEHDSRSIKSFESMLSEKRRDRRGTAGRKSLTDRLAHVSGLAALKGSPPPSRRSSILPQAAASTRFDTPGSSRPESPAALRLSPPNQRFVECAEDDIKVSEVGELLREYRRLVNGIRAIGGFDE